MFKHSIIVGVVCLAMAQFASAVGLKVSIGVRETDTAAAIGANGGTAGSIEWINLDGQTLERNNTWHQFVFNFGTDSVTSFTGNGALNGNRGVFEHIRFLNADGITDAINVRIDDIINTTAAGTFTIEDFEPYANGVEAVFRAPRFSGSTSANLLTSPNSSVVTDVDAFGGAKSDSINFQFVDNGPTRWDRLSTFNTANKPNPTIEYAPGDQLTFMACFLEAGNTGDCIIPEPSSLAVICLGALGILRRRHRA